MKTRKESTKLLTDWVISRIDHSIQDPNVGFVETLYHTCSTALSHLWKCQFRFIPYGPRKNTLKKDVANLRLWRENFPSGCLDTILEQSGPLKTNVVENMERIGTILMPYFATCDGMTTSAESESNSTQDLIQELGAQLEKAAIMLSAEDRSSSSSDDDASDDSFSTSESEQNRYGRLHCYVNCLMDVAPVIERHLSYLQHRVEPPSTHIENVFSLSQSAQPFAMRIRDRFTNAPTFLVESIRIRTHEEAPSEEDHPANLDTQTLFKPYSLFHDSGLGIFVPTRSQYAASHTSFLSITGEEAHGRPRVPPLPREGGLHFQCDYCRKTISIRNRIEWKMHVFKDLQSYLCTHAECKDALKTFRSRKLWADHELNEHFTQAQWRCFTCNITTVSQQLLVDHWIRSHNITLAGHRLRAAISESKEPVLKPDFKDHECALYSQAGWQTMKSYATHVGQHLEEISLACLPRGESDSSDNDSNTDTSGSSKKTGLHHPYNVDSHEADTNPGGGDNQARQSPGAPSTVIDSTIHTSTQHLSGEKSIEARLGLQYYRKGLIPLTTVRSQTTIARRGPMSAGASTIPVHERSQYSSYWSIAEQRDFPMLLSHFGRDFEGISNYMRTKTPVMIQNYFQRRVDSGNKDFEGIVAEAEAKKARGEPTGPLPVPNAALQPQPNMKQNSQG
ncbi:hypothetical protein BO94DRAFT_558822 [Aspergillus sclerotioniger CBS 115572]|uniref:Oxidoreductase acuF-like C2H2 type zinc-finger domain-containing protein n=1 Tax=Aspergillus sclerotioniger CBS 115572 TaxID=1450535 RepID=A0A317W2S6_9EURO|nr:hypothetical protein BO94DRAFT_558822 [Aspergillus sclerotioniger CBS 115572]PWY78490.1 hypothetical protein BO94DRAFT_558822 [Aspergillus sclerotioniger CBS 115572]